MDLEPEEVEEEWDDDQTDDASKEVLGEVEEGQSSLAAVDIKKSPKINGNSCANSEEGKQSNVLGRDDARQRKASQQQPLPPLPAKRNMSQLIKLDIGKQRASHGKDQSRIKQNQASLANMSVIEEDESRCDNAGWQGVARLPHNVKDNWDGQGTEEGWQCAVGDIWHFIVDVGVADVVKVEVSVIADQPPNEGKEELCEWWMDIEEVCALEVIRCKLLFIPISFHNRSQA